MCIKAAKQQLKDDSSDRTASPFADANAALHREHPMDKTFSHTNHQNSVGKKYSMPIPFDVGLKLLEDDIGIEHSSSTEDYLNKQKEEAMRKGRKTISDSLTLSSFPKTRIVSVSEVISFEKKDSSKTKLKRSITVSFEIYKRIMPRPKDESLLRKSLRLLSAEKKRTENLENKLDYEKRKSNLYERNANLWKKVAQKNHSFIFDEI
jgi:hypothetical protein